MTDSLRHRADDETMIAHGERGQAGGRIGFRPAVGEFEERICHERREIGDVWLMDGRNPIDVFRKSDRACRFISSNATWKSGNMRLPKTCPRLPQGVGQMAGVGRSYFAFRGFFLRANSAVDPKRWRRSFLTLPPHSTPLRPHGPRNAISPWILPGAHLAGLPRHLTTPPRLRAGTSHGSPSDRGTRAGPCTARRASPSRTSRWWPMWGHTPRAPPRSRKTPAPGPRCL